VSGGKKAIAPFPEILGRRNIFLSEKISSRSTKFGAEKLPC